MSRPGHLHQSAIGESGSSVLESLLKFLPGVFEGGKRRTRFEHSDYRLAVAALLVHTAAIAGNMSDLRRGQLDAVIEREFGLDEAAADQLVAEAIKAEHEAVDLYHFTSLINRSLDEGGRRRVVEMMWEIIYADGRVTDFESNLMWRAADLLSISSRERIELGQRVASRRAAAATRVRRFRPRRRSPAGGATP